LVPPTFDPQLYTSKVTLGGLAVPTSHRRAIDALGYQINILMDAVGLRSKESG
jgi:hypothetical protein